MILSQGPSDELGWWLQRTVELLPQRPRQRPLAESQQVLGIAEQSRVPGDAVEPPGVLVVHRSAERGGRSECLDLGRRDLIAPAPGRKEEHTGETERPGDALSKE